jgi:ubiquinone/menaquinone biosynthesis C-methylase UbiE|tara:strand:- start:89 stop:793 length:705 start_codon:yes stop_codon:yes gene_type:complete
MFYYIIQKIKKILWSKPEYRNLYWRFKHLIEPDWAKVYFDDRILNDGRNRDKLIEFINQLNQKNILEIGCASGANLFLLEEKKKYDHLEGIDISNYCIKEGKKILKRYNSNIVLKQGNAIKPNYKNKSFDIVFISGVAFDLTDKDLFLAVTESLRISKKYFILHISNYKLHPSLNIKSKGVLYKSHFLRDYHLFFKENFAKYSKKIIKLKKDTPEFGKEITYANLDYLIIIEIF